MKSISLLILLCIATDAFAQRNKLNEGNESFFRLGAKAIANVNKIQGVAYKNGFNFNFGLGAFAQINFTRKIGLQPEVNFMQATAEFADDPNAIYDDIFRDGSKKFSKLSLIEIPVLINVNIGPTKKVKLQVGPYFDGILKQGTDSLKTNYESIYKKANFGALSGLFVQLPLVHFGARYKINLSNMNAVDSREKWHSQAIQVFMGITF
jgi:hypothetical protein